MAVTNRQAILDDIAARLVEITNANGFRTEVAKVDRVLREWSDVGSGEKPWLGFAPDPDNDETVIHHPTPQMRMQMHFLVVGHVDAEPGSDKTSQLSDLVDDVIAKLYEDIGRGRDANNLPHAVLTQLEGYVTDEGHPDSTDSQGGNGTFVSRWRTTYNRKITKSP